MWPDFHIYGIRWNNLFRKKVNQKYEKYFDFWLTFFLKRLFQFLTITRQKFDYNDKLVGGHFINLFRMSNTCKKELSIIPIKEPNEKIGEVLKFYEQRISELTKMLGAGFVNISEYNEFEKCQFVLGEIKECQGYVVNKEPDDIKEAIIVHKNQLHEILINYLKHPEIKYSNTVEEYQLIIAAKYRKRQIEEAIKKRQDEKKAEYINEEMNLFENISTCTNLETLKRYVSKCIDYNKHFYKVYDSQMAKHLNGLVDISVLRQYIHMTHKLHNERLLRKTPIYVKGKHLISGYMNTYEIKFNRSGVETQCDCLGCGGNHRRYIWEVNDDDFFSSDFDIYATKPKGILLQLLENDVTDRRQLSHFF